MNINWTSIFSAISFLVLLFFLKRYVYDIVLNIIDERKEKIKNKIDSADDLREQAEQLKKKHDRRLKEAYDTAEEIKKEIIETANREKKEIISQAKEEAENLKKKTEKEIDLEIQKAKENLRKTSADLSVNIAEKIVEKEIDKSKHQKLIDEFLESVGDELEG